MKTINCLIDNKVGEKKKERNIIQINFASQYKE
jgi:hypothetical protein